MAIRNQETDSSSNSMDENASIVESVGINESRRRFTRSGAAVSGVLLTLASRSVMATAAVAKSPSGFVSGNASSHGPEPISNGRSPGYWKNHTSQWPSGLKKAKFSEVFVCNSYSVYSKYTLLELLTPQKIDKDGLARHLIASFLNARARLTPFPTEEQVLRMFSEWQVDGTFSPAPGVSWNAAQIVQYLQATQG